MQQLYKQCRKSNGNSIEFSLSNADKGAVGLILALELASLTSIFIHHNKITSRIVSKLLMGLTILNQALICTPTPNLIAMIRSELMISQAFQACYSIEDCPSNCCILSQERIGYMVGNIYQLNLSPRLPQIGRASCRERV